ncbi:MAG TPA: SUF system NifU family Fe-S cluster assembly protein, partial [Pyrinomonadaceae bacterium]|nr:SUF system NifU family Fe-S cluster assembly protein [Pyrinomonadaceae bacterium]
IKGVRIWMSELSDLYQEVILEHNKNPRNFREIADADRYADGNNPLCGDALRVYVSLDGDTVTDVAFKGSGCAISKASASMMTQAVKGKSKNEAEIIFDEFHRMVLGELDEETEENHLGRLKIFAGVREFPARVKCASLSWHTLNAALHGEDVISTE